jgi:hypothetical protein
MMSDSTLINIWDTLINYPRIPFKQVAKRCKTNIKNVEIAAALMGKFANTKRNF